MRRFGKCHKSYSIQHLFPPQMFPIENAMRTVTANSSFLFLTLQILNSRTERKRDHWTQTFVFLLKMLSTQSYLVPLSFGCKPRHVGPAKGEVLGHHLPLPPLTLFLTQTTSKKTPLSIQRNPLLLGKRSSFESMSLNKNFKTASAVFKPPHAPGGRRNGAQRRWCGDVPWCALMSGAHHAAPALPTSPAAAPGTRRAAPPQPL